MPDNPDLWPLVVTLNHQTVILKRVFFEGTKSFSTVWNVKRRERERGRTNEDGVTRRNAASKVTPMRLSSRFFRVANLSRRATDRQEV